METTRTPNAQTAWLETPAKSKARHRKRAATLLTTPGPIAVKGLPGTGKTALAIAAINQGIANGIDPKQIQVITFANGQVNDFEKRIRAEGLDIAVTTIHAFAFSIIREHYPLLGFSQCPSLIEPQQAFTNIKTLGASLIEPADIGKAWAAIREHKNTGKRITATKAANSLKETDPDHLNHLIKQFQEICKQECVIDYDDMTHLALELLDNHPPVSDAISARYQLIIVDEVQDLPPIPLFFTIAAAQSAKHSLFCGDHHQSIYSWRHATPNAFDAIENASPQIQTVELNHSHRLTSQIADLANAVMRANGYDINIKASRQGLKPTLTVCPDRHSQGEAIAAAIRLQIDAGVSPDQIAVLGRNHQNLSWLPPYLDQLNIPYSPSYYGKHHIRHIEALQLFLKAISGDLDATAAFLCRVSSIPTNLASEIAPQWLNDKNLKLPTLQPTTGILAGWRGAMKAAQSEKRPESALHLYTQNYQPSLKGQIKKNWQREAARLFWMAKTSLDYATFIDQLDGERTRLHKAPLHTIHASKGAEWDVVFLVDVYDGAIPYHQTKNEMEELRLFFTGLTRPRHELHLFTIELELLYHASNTNEVRDGTPQVKRRMPHFLTETPNLEDYVSIKKGKRR